MMAADTYRAVKPAPTVSLAYRIIPPAHGGYSPCQDRKCHCSGGVADAVRNDALCPDPLDESYGAVLFFCDLTPARWDAKKLACQMVASGGSGGVVLARTGAEPAQNQQGHEIKDFFGRFSRFYAKASRHAHARMCAGARAHPRGAKHRTIEPAANSDINQLVSGSVAVLWRFWPEPVNALGANNGGLLRFSNKIGQVYPGELSIWGEIGARLGNVLGGGAGSAAGSAARHGRSSVAWSRPGSCCAGAALINENGGFLRFCDVALAAVGMAVSERAAQTHGFAWFFRVQHKPARLVPEQCGERPCTRIDASPSSAAPPPHAPICAAPILLHAAPRDFFAKRPTPAADFRGAAAWIAKNKPEKLSERGSGVKHLPRVALHGEQMHDGSGAGGKLCAALWRDLRLPMCGNGRDVRFNAGTGHVN